MDQQTINSVYIRRLLEKLRSAMSLEGAMVPEIGGNASDDERPATLQETSGDLHLQDLTEGIEAMDDDHKHKLVAIMWLGHRDFLAAIWPEARSLAAERYVGPTSPYLLFHPRVVDLLASGLEELG